MNSTKKPTARKQPAPHDARQALAAKTAAERRDRIESLARGLVAIAEGLPGDADANLKAVCTAALCDALDGVARSRS